jgi:hypothetical protein
VVGSLHRGRVRPSPSLFVNFWWPERSQSAYASLEHFLSDVVAILRDEVAELVRLGATYIQIDAPPTLSRQPRRPFPRASASKASGRRGWRRGQSLTGSLPTKTIGIVAITPLTTSGEGSLFAKIAANRRRPSSFASAGWARRKWPSLRAQQPTRRTGDFGADRRCRHSTAEQQLRNCCADHISPASGSTPWRRFRPGSTAPKDERQRRSTRGWAAGDIARAREPQGSDRPCS